MFDLFYKFMEKLDDDAIRFEFLTIKLGYWFKWLFHEVAFCVFLRIVWVIYAACIFLLFTFGIADINMTAACEKIYLITMCSSGAIFMLSILCMKHIAPTGNLVTFEKTNIRINSKVLSKMLPFGSAYQMEITGVLALKGKEPTIYLFEDGVQTRAYTLETEHDEDFTGKYFLFSVRIYNSLRYGIPLLQLDGFISDTPNNRAITTNDIGYRMEGHYLACGGETAAWCYEQLRGEDLVAKGLKYPGYTTPSNIRLIGICPDCGKSFCFHGYSFYMLQHDVAYSDDGLDCCEIQTSVTNMDSWLCVGDGKVFRYYNSFRCPHCGSAYLDYQKHRKNKQFGVPGCVLIGRKHYTTTK